MKKTIYIFSILFWVILFLPNFVSAQKNPAGEWLRVQSDNSEFSIEFPAASDFFLNNGSFHISRETASYELKEMRMLNAYHEKTMLSFEIYKTDSPKAVADIFADRDEKNGKQSEIKIGGAKFKQVIMEAEDRYAVRRFYVSKDYLYILTAASRDGETVAMKRFFDSLRLKTDKIQIEPVQSDSTVKNVSFSALKVFQLEIEKNPEPIKQPIAKNSALPAPEKRENSLPLIILVKPVPSYTDAARKSGEKGKIRVRAAFSKNGSITKIAILSVLNDGLLREAVFAAIRMKFIPAQKNGEPVNVTKTIEYGFDIY